MTPPTAQPLHEGAGDSPRHNETQCAPAKVASAPDQDWLKLPPPGRAFLDQVVELNLLTRSSARVFLDQTSERLADTKSATALGEALVRAGLLTSYQVHRVLAGTTHGLVLGNYRVLERLGAGGMGVVFLAEHYLLMRRVAIKVLPVEEECPAWLRQRFFVEMRVLADLHHPNIVTAYDAGELPSAGGDQPALNYLVMELVSGGDLEKYVVDHGPRPIPQACDWVRQAACGLQEAHDLHLIHRDVKPSNLLLSAQGQVKLVDFGLVRQFSNPLTDPRSLLGSIQFMAPEQSHDPSAVGVPADIYGLGATLFWLLTGETPYPLAPSVAASLRLLQQTRPRRLRTLRPDAPEELEALLERMLDRDPLRRPAMPLAIVNALLPFADSSTTSPCEDLDAPLPSARPSAQGRRLLIVGDETPVRQLSRAALEPLGYVCSGAADVATALDILGKEAYDLVLLDLDLVNTHGQAVCRRLRERPHSPNLKIIVVSGGGDQNAEAFRGADDHVSKPFPIRQLQAKARHAMRLKAAEDRADHLLLANRQLEHSLEARAADVRQAQDALLFAMAKMAESRDGETPGHLRRLQLYTRCLAERVARDPRWSGRIDSQFLEHDIGKIGLPDEVLLKPGRLNAAERALMETHPLIGDRILEALSRQHGQSLAFLGTARAIVRHHHERYDGRGYPDFLVGQAIPVTARLVAVADVYDALRRKRLHKPAMTHADAVRVIVDESPGQFDPCLLDAFMACHGEFGRIYQDISE